MRRSREEPGGLRRRAVVWTVVVAIAAAGVGLAVWFTRGGSTPQAAAAVITVTRGNVRSTVGGVGRITEAAGSAQIVVGRGTPSGAASGGGSAANAGTGAAAAPPNAVFARAGGHLGRLMVAPNQRVRAGQLLAVVDDGGVAAAALAQAQNDYSSALLEAGADAGAAQLDASRAAADLEALRGGAPAARARALLIARRNARLARERLRTALAPPTPADVGAARAEVARAEADLAALRSTPPSSPEALAAAQQAVAVAEQRIARLRAPADPAAVRAAQADLRTAEADLAALQTRDPPPTQAELDAATLAVSTARAALARLTGPPDPAELGAAQLDLDRARAELAALTRPPAASPEALASAQRALDAARLKLARVLAGTVTADRTSARLELQRAESELRALESGPSPTALAAAHSAAAAAAARLAFVSSQPKVKAARALLTSARLAARMLTVRAPAAGTVTALFTAQGAPVDPSTPIVAVADLQHLVASVDLSEFDVARVRRGQKAVVSVDALGGRAVPGSVRLVALTGNDSGGVVSFPVTISLDRTKGLRAGLNASVRIIVAQRTGVVKVPLEAVSSDAAGNSVVTVVDASGHTSARRVTLGLEDNKSVEITKGLSAGERVALPVPQGNGP